MIPTLAERVRTRARAEKVLRKTLDERGLTEVAAPTIVPNPGMETHLRAFDLEPVEAIEWRGHALHTSPEFAIKSHLAALGFDVYALVRTYRDEPPSPSHHPEFTMLEWYRIGADYSELFADTEAIVRATCEAFGGVPPALVAPFERVTVDDAFRAAVGVPSTSPAGPLLAALRARGVDAADNWDRETAFSVAYAELVEPTFTEQPTFLYAFPADMAALARLSPEDPTVAERFELYLPTPNGGIELANAFGELVDADEQRRRFESDRAKRRARGLPDYGQPEAMLRGLEALGPTSGIALGWERLLMWASKATRGWDTRVADWFLL